MSLNCWSKLVLDDVVVGNSGSCCFLASRSLHFKPTRYRTFTTIFTSGCSTVGKNLREVGDGKI